MPAKAFFPQVLMSILNDPSLNDVISWLPHGKAFVILRPDVLCEEVLPRYLESSAATSTQYTSFTRKLNRWGFFIEKAGPDAGSFSCPLFQRDRPLLCADMICQRTRDYVPKRKKRKPDMSALALKQAPPPAASTAQAERKPPPVHTTAGAWKGHHNLELDASKDPYGSITYPPSVADLNMMQRGPMIPSPSPMSPMFHQGLPPSHSFEENTTWSPPDGAAEPPGNPHYEQSNRPQPPFYDPSYNYYGYHHHQHQHQR